MELICKNEAFDKINKEYGEGNIINLKQIINSIPAVDAVPIVHGHWYLGRCSKCDGHAPYWSMATTYYKSLYCPHCGAKMDEGREQDEN